MWSLVMVREALINGHHTVEDVGICLGQAIKKVKWDKRGINRYGSSRIPMDESLALVDLSIANRSFLVFNVEMPLTRVGGFETELTDLEYGRNTHYLSL